MRVKKTIRNFPQGFKNGDAFSSWRRLIIKSLYPILVQIGIGSERINETARPQGQAFLSPSRKYFVHSIAHLVERRSRNRKLDIP